MVANYLLIINYYLLLIIKKIENEVVSIRPHVDLWSYIFGVWGPPIDYTAVKI